MRVFRSLALLALFHAVPLSAATAPAAAQWYIAGNRLYYQKQYDQALQDLTQSLRLDNHQAPAYQAVGSCYYAKGQMDLALRYYKYSLQINPNNEPLKGLVARMEASQADPLAQGHHLYQSRRYADALSAYKRVAETQPQNAKAFQSIGNCQYAMGDRVAALASYRQAMALNPANKPLADFVARLDRVQTATVNGADQPRDWVQPLWRSAILPGWGQGYNGQTTKGVALGGLTLALAAATVATDLIGQQAANTYSSLSGANADYNTPYNTWSEMATANHVCYIAFGALYAYTLFDAAVNGRPLGSATAAAPSLVPNNLEVAFQDNGVQMKWKVAEF